MEICLKCLQNSFREWAWLAVNQRRYQTRRCTTTCWQLLSEFSAQNYVWRRRMDSDSDSWCYRWL